MNVSITAVLVGLAIGAFVVSLLALFFVYSRPYRRIRDFRALALGYFLLPALTIGGILLVNRACVYLHVGAKSSARDYSVGAFAVSFVVGMISTIVSELRWQKRIRSHINSN